MKVYQQVDGYEESITNLTISIDDTFSGFSVAAGTGNVVAGEGGSTGLLNSGLFFLETWGIFLINQVGLLGVILLMIHLIFQFT